MILNFDGDCGRIKLIKFELRKYIDLISSISSDETEALFALESHNLT
jgi:hypothetical protein